MILLLKSNLYIYYDIAQQLCAESSKSVCVCLARACMQTGLVLLLIRDVNYCCSAYIIQSLSLSYFSTSVFGQRGNMSSTADVSAHL